MFSFFAKLFGFNQKNTKNNEIFEQPSREEEAIIISCYFNPLKSAYRKKAFDIFYEGIKHLPHQIVECVIGNTTPELPENKNIKRVFTKNLLWHKETLLNNLIKNLPPHYKYIFWVDADVIFQNPNWFEQSITKLQNHHVIQLFEYCVHLEKNVFMLDDKKIPEIYADNIEKLKNNQKIKNMRVWKSFCATPPHQNKHTHYDIHGHVGFAWGAKREILEKIPLYDRALIGGADHIIAHASMGHISKSNIHECIQKSFTEDLDNVVEWAETWYKEVQGNIGFCSGTLLHIWHGDLKKRQYLKRIKEFTPKSKNIQTRDENGFYIYDDEYIDDESYLWEYFETRENTDDDEYEAQNDTTDTSYNTETNVTENNDTDINMDNDFEENFS